MPAEAPWRMFEEGVRTRPAERCCLGPCSLELGRGVLYGAGMMAVVSLIATIVDIARMFKHSDDTYISFVFFAGAVLSICSLAVSLRTVYLIRAGKTAGLSPLIVILLILAGLCVVSMAFNFHVGYKVCKNQDSEFAQHLAYAKNGGPSTAFAVFDMEESDFDQWLGLTPHHTGDPIKGVVRFEELPLGGGGAHIGDLNISIFLQGLHDGPHSWYIYENPDCGFRAKDDKLFKPVNQSSAWDLSGRHGQLWYTNTPGKVYRPHCASRKCTDFIHDKILEIADSKHPERSILGKGFGITKTVMDKNTGAACKPGDGPTRCPVLACARIMPYVSLEKDKDLVKRYARMCNAEYDFFYAVFEIVTASWYLYFAYLLASYKAGGRTAGTAPAGSDNNMQMRSQGSAQPEPFEDGESAIEMGGGDAAVGAHRM